jgi:hypothetical protein
LGFVALKPTYILAVLLRNAKPNNGRFRNRAPKVSISINLAVFWPAALNPEPVNDLRKFNGNHIPAFSRDWNGLVIEC